MAKEGDGHGEELGVTEATPEQTAAIYAAMMEELGIARKDTLPLEDKKGTGGHVDLSALDRDKKANDPRTAEFRMAQKNASAHSAWKNAVFDDVDEADLELDDMNSGQSHRQRMKAELEASSTSKGGHVTHGSRGGQLTRGSSSHSLSRNNPGGFGGRVGGKSESVDINKVLARLRGHSGPQGKANRGMRGTPRSDFAKPIKHADIVIAPKSNLSFGDNRSVNALPFGRNALDKSASAPDSRTREPQAAPKAAKPNNYNQGFKLASPEDFLAQSWAGKGGKNSSDNLSKEVADFDPWLDQARKPTTEIENTPRIKARTPVATATPPSASIAVQSLSKRSTIRSALASSNDRDYSTPVQIANEIGGKVVMINSGRVCIKNVGQNPNIANIIQVEILGKTLLKEPVLGSFDFRLDQCTISFYSGFDANRTKWILTASQPEIAASLAEALERFKRQSRNVNSNGAPDKNHINKVEEDESLISFSDEDPTPPQALSQFTEDLFSLMGAEFIADAVNAISLNMGQNYTLEAASGVTGSHDADFSKTQQKTFRGLATSRFANQVEVGDFLNRSAIFQKLPDSTAAYIKAQVSKGVLEEAQKDACDQDVFEPVKQQSRKQYSVEVLMGLRNHPRFADKPSGLDPCVQYASKGQPQILSRFAGLVHIASENPSLPTSETAIQSSFRTTRLGVSIVSDRETSLKLFELATSKYASPQKEVTAQESRTLEEQELYNAPKVVEPRAMRPLRGLSSSKYASPTSNSLSRDHMDTKKPGSSSKRNYPSKEFKSFLNSQENQPPRQKPSQGLPGLGQPDTSQVKPLLKHSTSSGSEAASMEPLKDLLNQKLCEPPVRKPYQGLASSKYAGPLPTKLSATETNLTASVQGGPNIPTLIAKLPITKAIILDPTVSQAVAARSSTFSMIIDGNEGQNQEHNVAYHKVSTAFVENGTLPSPKSGGWNTLRRRGSFESHASKDSDETVKPLPKPTLQIVDDYPASIQPSRAASGHQSILSTDSNISCESFATAIGETNSAREATGGKNQTLANRSQPYGIQTGFSDFVLFPDSMTEPEAHGKDLHKESPYSSDMSELMGDPVPAAAQMDASDVKLASFFKPFSFATMSPSKFVTKAKGGLLSSKYARSNENIAPAATKPKPQPSSVTESNEVKKGHATDNIAPKPLIRDTESNTSLNLLKPTASQFTPSVSQSLTAPIKTVLPPAMNTFPNHVQPVMATIFVPDPQNAGMLIEVSGLLKMGSTPVVGYVAAHDSPMGKILTSGGTVGTIASPRRASPLTPVVQMSSNTKDRQQEIQERLTKSLTKRQHSQSPGPGSF